MRLPGRPAEEHLTYCTNVHPGESLAEVLAALERYVPRIRALTAPEERFGVGLRLSAAAADTLGAPGQLAALTRLLDRHDAYVFTINGFPYGTFHRRPVKALAYAPDWSDPARLRYTDRLADLLAHLLPEGVPGSISTVPLGLRGVLERRGGEIVANLVRHVARLAEVERRTGRTIALALEPEPGCALETTDEAIRFIEDHLLVPAALDPLARRAGFSRSRAEAAIRRHVGVCLDVCHAAVEFEDVGRSVAALQAAAIAIPKIQLSSALRVPAMSEEAAGALRRFDEPVYLHQVVSRRGDALRRYADLGEALHHLPDEIGAEWRVHFHVPLFRPDLDVFSTTQDVLSRVLEMQRAEPIAPHLEIETYTWDVLPPAFQTKDLSDAIAREYDWVAGRLAT